MDKFDSILSTEELLELQWGDDNRCYPWKQNGRRRMAKTKKGNVDLYRFTPRNNVVWWFDIFLFLLVNIKMYEEEWGVRSVTPWKIKRNE